MKRTALRAKSLKRQRTKPGPWRSKVYLAWVRSLPCCITGTPFGVVVHHLLRGSDKCGGRTASDWWAIPLCGQMHAELHADGNETRFLEPWGIDGPALARALYEAYPDREQGCRVLHKLERISL
jgi:hypothetical protein